MKLMTDYPMLDSTSVVPVIQSSTFEGEHIIDCKVVRLAYSDESPLQKCLADGWRLVQIVWTREETTNFGQAPAVNHILKAVVVKTEKKEN